MAGTLRPDAVFSEWTEQSTDDNHLAVEELLHLEMQASVSAKFLKAVLEILDSCLSTKAVHKNVQVLYALLHSTTSNAGRHDLLAPFRDKTLVTDYEYNTREEQETLGAWAMELCRATDPLTDVVAFMHTYLDDKRAAGQGGWVDVETVMRILTGGIRSYRTQRAAQEKMAHATLPSHPSSSAAADDNGGDNNDNSDDASFVYEEVDGASAFFLPYSWSLVLDSTRELVWPLESIELFPSTPYFLEDAISTMEDDHAQDDVQDDGNVGYDLELDAPL